MNKNTVIAITIIILLLLIGGGYLLMSRSKPSVTNQSANNKQPASADTSETNTGETTQQSSLKSLMALTGSQKCTFSDLESGSSGEMYLNNGRMRGDFNSKIDNRIVASHMISEADNAYVWMDDQPSGFKVSLKSMEGLNTQANTNAPQTVDINKVIDYKCSAWRADASVFTVPADIKFEDMSALLEETGKMMNEVNSSEAVMPDNTAACLACNSAPADSQAQCKALLKCN